MGRSRGVAGPAADDDSSHRSKRRRVSSSGEALESLPTGQNTNEGKNALYHCNYCNKDISGKIRIKCSKCPDFDLCVECFSVGAEVTPHKSNHPYRVMDNLSFPLICPDWNADEEILLLEGIEMYGLGNWAEVAEHVGTKSKAQCVDHYTTAYMNSACYPLPDMSRVNGKNRKELLAMAKVQGASMIGDGTPKEESPFSPSRIKLEDMGGESSAGRSISSTDGNKNASNSGQVTNGPLSTKLEEGVIDRSVGGKKPKYSGDVGPSVTELSGYNPKRHEFDLEYDHDAEKALADMEFKENDTDAERQLKLRVLKIYLSRLDERKRRKEFILERKLLLPNPLEKELPDEDKEIYQRYKVFMRFLSQEEYDALVRSSIEERKIRRRIQELQECRAAGCRTLSEAKIYTEQKRRKELESNAQKRKESGPIIPTTNSIPKTNRPIKGESDESPRSTIDSKKGFTVLDSAGKASPSMGSSGSKSWDDWDITGLPGAELLSASENNLCSQSRLLPCHYLKMQEVLVQEIFKGTVAKKSDAHGIFKVDPVKVDRIYDIVMKKLGRQDESPSV